MTRYLILAHQTAASRELVKTLKEITATARDAAFTLVVPSAPLHYWRTWDETKSRAYAENQADLAREMLAREGIELTTAIGSRYPMDALADELRDGPGYDELIICTLPQGVSRWLKLDLPHQASRRFGLPVTHVIATARELSPSA